MHSSRTVNIIDNSMAVPLNEIIQINQGVLLIQSNQINTRTSIEAIISIVTQLWWMAVSKTLQLRLICYFSIHFIFQAIILVFQLVRCLHLYGNACNTFLGKIWNKKLNDNGDRDIELGLL